MPKARKKQKEDFLRRWGSVKAFGKELTRPTEDLYTSKTTPDRRAVQTAKLVKYLPEMVLKPMAKVGGAIRSTARGEAPEITHEDLISGVLAGIVGGKPGGLPSGAVGTGMTRSQALKSLGKSAVGVRNRAFKIGKEREMSDYISKTFQDVTLPKTDVRAMAASVRKLPTSVLKPVSKIEYAKFNDPRIRGQTSSYPDGITDIALAPHAQPRTLFHEGEHAFERAVKGERSLPGYLAEVLRTASTRGTAIASKINRSRGTKTGFYRNRPTETQARIGAARIEKVKGSVSASQHEKIFVDSSKKVIKDLKRRAPKLYKSVVKDVAKRYKTTKAKKRLTPGEMARALQDAAEAKGPPMYLRRKAGAELPKGLDTTKKKPFKIRRKAD